MTYHTSTKRHPFSPNQVKLCELFQFRCSWQWLTAGVGASGALGLLTTLAVRYKPLRLPLLATLGTIGALGGSYAFLIEPRRPILRKFTLTLPTLPAALDGLRIGHMSDLHIHFPYTRNNTRWAVERMREERPDLIALTGDFVSFTDAIPELPALLHRLEAPLGVYAVPGNHDHWEGLEAVRSHLEPLGIEFLLNTHKQLSWHNGECWVVGVDDMWYGLPDIETALAGVPHDAFTLLLAHSPDYADIAAAYNVSLQLSGHTHGGHLRLPVLGWFCVPFYGFHYVDGTHTVGNTCLSITRGLGGMPMRFNCSPEASVITLRRSAQNEPSNTMNRLSHRYDRGASSWSRNGYPPEEC